MEIWDGYNADKTLAGVDILRSSEKEGKYPKGLYHLVADVVVRHKDGTYLVMQRDFRKEGFPGAWEIGAGGSVLKGETAHEGALRELKEETGINADSLTLINEVSVVHENGVGVHYSVFLCETDVDKHSVTLQEGETIAYRWLTAEEILSGSFVPQRRIDVVDKLARLNIIRTERLLLRPLSVEDVPTIHLYASDVQLTRYMMNLPNDTVEESRTFAEEAEREWSKPSPDFYEYAVMLDGAQIGGVCLYLEENGAKGELGWILSREYHGKGYAFEAAQAMLKLARYLGLRSVFARCDLRNIPSAKLMERLKMTLVDRNGTRYYNKKQETAGELVYELQLS